MTTDSSTRVPGLDFVAIDFETANPNHASVCQIGIARIRDGIVTHKATGFFLPSEGDREFGYWNKKVHGLSFAMGENALGWESTLPRLIKFAGDLPPGGPQRGC
ncbi:hypothetical protein [Arthrobacter zhaoguopingii]|uniref:hypothetical protein n=1 Tax=Arthrobacter zhaoguopingii TaxID=2681491 RepID=UPI00135C71DE|nr:hypothetical protein [Arthrobacter zhaoguopingii]